MLDKKLILETTPKCNLNCNYCYMPEKGAKTTPLRVIKKSIERFVENNKKSLLVTFHGGEPLLVGIEKFEEFIRIEKEYNTKNLQIKNNIQTNGTLINPSWIDFFKRNSFHVGLSLDGPKEIHDKNRVYFNGNGSFENVQKAIKLLKKGNVPFGVITVLTKDSLGKEKEIYDTLKKTGAKSFKVNFYSVAGKGKKSQRMELSPKEKFETMKKFYDLYKTDNTRIQRFSPFDRIIESFFTGKNAICEYNGKCNIDSILFVDSRGDIYSCGRFIENKTYSLGNVFQNSIGEIKESSFYKKLTERTSKLEKEIMSSYFKFHRGGCPYDALLKNGDLTAPSSDYGFKEELIEYIYKDVKKRLNENQI